MYTLTLTLTPTGERYARAYGAATRTFCYRGAARMVGHRTAIRAAGTISIYLYEYVYVYLYIYVYILCIYICR